MTTSALRRQVKNIVHNYSEAEIKVREATSNDPWGPSSSLMSEIADLTFNVVAFAEVMSMVWKRLNDHGKNWRHVYKALTLLDCLIKTGSERVAQQCRENAFTIQTLRDFQYMDRDGRDQGGNVREKARQLVSLLRDEERLRQERSQALKTKERMAGGRVGGGTGGGGGTGHGGVPPANHPGRRTSQPSMAVLYGEEFSRSRGSPSSFNSSSSSPREASDLEQARPQTSGEEELQLQLALAMSREESEKSTILDLVDIFSTPSSEAPPPPDDPWNSLPAVTSDPWDRVGAVNCNTATIGYPWKTRPSSSSPINPWAPSGSPTWDAPPASSSSPASHGCDSPPPHPREGTHWTDPFSIREQEESKEEARPADSPTDLFGERVLPPLVNGTEVDMFDPSRPAPTLGFAIPQMCRTPEAFLGTTGACLVNLDTLIPSHPPNKTHNNPFLIGLSAPSPLNPFHCDQPRLTLNQMLRPSSTSPLPSHTLSYSPSLPLSLTQKQSRLPSSHTQPANGLLDIPQNLPHPLLPLSRAYPPTHSHNPFL
ncbi:hypothetical protein DPEC_G00170180 [Dallia pectoralis]|uniref:Uncharacterized protein n=1 Tax=Dallia pectoralis TaxID=75939 RepID=A0ACC2GDB6_DALPE|nr:hypothetical protein DPEC_G00170180 [Dallia pectoralis]